MRTLVKSGYLLQSLALVLFASGLGTAADLPRDLKEPVEARARTLAAIGSDPQLVAAVRAYNTNPPAALSQMSNQVWRTLSVSDPLVLSLSTGPLVDHLKSLIDPSI